MKLPNILTRFSRKAASVTAQWIEATVRAGEKFRGSAYDPNASQLIARCYGYADVCSTRIAKHAAMIPLKLYRPVNGPKKGLAGGRAIPISKATRKFLLSDAMIGTKAQEMLRSDNDLEEVVDHPILDILNNPNSDQSGPEFRELRRKFMLITGSSYVLPDRKMGTMRLLFPQWVRVVGGTEGLIDSYIYGRASEKQDTFAAEDVWRSVQSPSPFSPFEGLSPLRAVLIEMDIYSAVNQTELAIFDNCARPDAVVSIEQNASDDGVKAIRSQLEARHRGAQSSGRFAIVANSKATITPLGWAPKDLGNVELQKHVTLAVLAAYGVPESEVFMNDANLASSRTGNVQYQRQTVLPCAIQDGEDFTRWIVDGEFGLQGWCLAPENIIGVDEDAENTRTLAQVAGGVVTANEWRRLHGYDEITDESADMLRVNGQAIAVMDEVARRPPPSPFGGMGVGNGGATDRGDDTGDQPGGMDSGDGGSDKADDGSGKGIADVQDGQSMGVLLGLAEPIAIIKGNAPPAQLLPAAEPKAHAAHEPVKCCDHAKVVKQSDLWSKEVDPTASSDGEADDAIVRWYEVINAGLLGRRDQMIAASNEAPHGLDKKTVGVRGTKESVEALTHRLLSAWKVTGQAEAFAQAMLLASDAEARAVFEQGVRNGLGQVNAIADDEPGRIPIVGGDRAQRYYSEFNATYIRHLAEVDRTTAASVESAIRAGLEAGDGLRGMQSRIKAVFDDPSSGEGTQTISEARAAMIARTEAATANVQGQFGGYAEAGVEHYEFNLAPNPCEFCEAVAAQYAGKKVPIGTPLYRQGQEIRGADGGVMQLNYADVTVPVHPNCRCDIQPAV